MQFYFCAFFTIIIDVLPTYERKCAQHLFSLLNPCTFLKLHQLPLYTFCLPLLQSMDHFDDIGPSVVMASPGMMQSGLSRELFESWCTDKRNGVIIAGYCVEGTLAKVEEIVGSYSDAIYLGRRFGQK